MKMIFNYFLSRKGKIKEKKMAPENLMFYENTFSFLEVSVARILMIS